MSGFEIVGVILGSLPIIVKVAEDYKKGLEPLARWRRYKFEFRAFVNDVDIEKQMFDALIERLLQYTDLSAERKDSLLSGQDADGWCEIEVGRALKQRLGESYDTSMYLLETMKSDMLNLQEMLSLKYGSVDWARPGQDQWHYQRKRISHSFSRKGRETVASLERNNKRFRYLLDVLDQRATAERPISRRTRFKDTTWVRVFECIRQHASSLHAVLHSGWKCTCVSPHLATLQLQARSKGDQTTQFIMVCMVSNEQNKMLGRKCQYEVTVRQLITIKDQTSDQDSFTSRTRPTDHNNYLSRLRSNMEISTGMAQQGDSSYFAPLSLSVPKTLNLIPKKRSRDSEASDSKSSQSSDTHPIATEHMSANKEPSSTFASAIRKVAWMDPPTDRKARTRPIKPVTVLPPSPDQQTIDATNDDTEIKDLCSTLFNTNSGVSYVGHLCCPADYRHEFRSLKNSELFSEQTELVNLNKLLSESENRERLTRKQRFRLTVVVASSLLQLQSTPWITTRLDKTNIFFQYDSCKGEILTEQPFVRHLFYSRKQPPRPPLVNSGALIDNGIRQMASNSAVDTNDTMILEHHSAASETFNPAVTNPMSKSQHLQTPSSRSARFATKASLYQLGILLLELCFGQTIESISIRNQFLINGVAHNQTDFLTALEWKSDVEEEAGEDFQIAVNSCFNFDVNPDWNDIKFTQSIHAGVVQHLEKALADLGWADDC